MLVSIDSIIYETDWDGVAKSLYRIYPDSTMSLAPKRHRFYYGWVIVGAMSFTMALSMALGTLNFGLFIRPMGDQLGIGRASFGWAQTARAAAAALTSQILGRLIDRYGSRVLMAVGAGIAGSPLIGVFRISQAWQLIALFAATGLIGLGGPGALVMAGPVAKWFVRHIEIRERREAYRILDIRA